jgi:precorrin-2 dehydrogenase/sirohydrochlorin ferrochelatase
LKSDPETAKRDPERPMPPYYPILLDLSGRPCVVLGGSRTVAALTVEKVRGLWEVGARVTLVTPELPAELAGHAGRGDIRWLERGYRPGDLAGAFLAIVTAADPDLREAAWLEATRRNIPLNTVDDVPRCSFIAPSVLRRGDLTVAVSTGGKAPALAVRLRQRLEGELGSEHARFLELAGRVRKPLAARHPDFGLRRELWYRLVDSDVLELLRRGDETAARGRFLEILGVEIDLEPVEAVR